MLKLIKRHGKIICCGAISSESNDRNSSISVDADCIGYNDKGFNISNWGEVIFNRYTIHGASIRRIVVLCTDEAGFIFFDHPELVPKGREDLAKWLKDGTLTNTEGETVVPAKFEEIPEVYQKLFSGANQGKLITKLQ